MAAKRSDRGHPQTGGPHRAPFPPHPQHRPPNTHSLLLIDSVFHNLIGSNPLSCLTAAEAASLPACAEKRFSRSGRRGGGLTANAEPPLRPCPPSPRDGRLSAGPQAGLGTAGPGGSPIKVLPTGTKSKKTGQVTFYPSLIGSLDPTQIRTHTSRPPSQTESFSPETKSRPRTSTERER